MAGDQDRTEGEGPRDWDETEGEPLETERLALEEEERLPWLESSDDDYNDDASDTQRMMGFVLMGLVALAAIVGGIWWATHRSAGPQPADGSVIAAPSEPYKSAPADPGGKTFEGTGDSSFAVSEGQARPAQLGSGGSGSPAAATSPAPKASASAAAGAAAPAAASGGVGVQVGAYSSNAAAEAGWSSLASRHSAILAGVKHRVVQGTADIGTVYRLQAVAGDNASANALCGKLKGAGTPCQVK
jgi:hypothetical protein